MNLDDLKREVGQLIQDRAMDFSYPVKLEVDQGAYIAKHVLDYLHAQGLLMVWKKPNQELPKKPGLKNYEYVDCLIIHEGQIKARPWNCEHLCFDDEHYDDHYCEASEIEAWMPLPAAQKGDGK